MAKPVKSIVQATLAQNGRDAKLLAAMEYGWARRTAHPDHLKFRRKTTRAELVWEATVDKAVELFIGDAGVRPVEHHDTMSFIFDNRVLLRFKKADLNLKTSNIPTLLADMFHEHDADLFGYRGLQRIEAVYVLEAFERGMAWAGIVARDNNTVLWHFELAPEIATMQLRPEKAKKSTATLAKVMEDIAGEKMAEKKDGVLCRHSIRICCGWRGNFAA
jgi:hypothetical protein